jgi:multidrug efflux pump subunit AcrA (membrane-fusion protein)
MQCAAEQGIWLPEPAQMHVKQQQEACLLREELDAARAEAEATRAESSRLAAEVDALRSALAQSATARQQEVAEILQSAAAHQAVVRADRCCPHFLTVELAHVCTLLTFVLSTRG